MNIRLIVPLMIVGLIAAAWVWRVRVAPSILDVSRNDVHFPTVSGSNLDRQELTFPADFAGETNLLFVPFLQPQQAVVNTWLPFAQELEASFPGVIYYELPTIDRFPVLRRTFVNEGMRAGIPDPVARERTVTLYIDTAEFMRATDIPSKNEVHILLVNRDGDILWRSTGVYSAEKGAAIVEVLNDVR